MKPREKVLQLGPEALTDVELLMLIIGSGSGGLSVEHIAHSLINKYSTLYHILRASPLELMEMGGIGKATAAKLAAIGEIIRRGSVTKLPDREYVIFVCKDGSYTYVIGGGLSSVDIVIDPNVIKCNEVYIYHYHMDEKHPSVSDELLVLKLNKMGFKVLGYKLLTSRLDIFDVLSKVDYIKGE